MLSGGNNLKNLSLGKKITLVIGVLWLGLVIGTVSIKVMNADHVIMGVKTQGTNLSGMTQASAEKFFHDMESERLAQPAAILTYKDQSWTIKPEDIHLTGNPQEVADAAYVIGRDGTPMQNLLTQVRCALFGKDIKLEGSYDEKLLDAKLAEVKKHVDKAPVNASVTLANNGAIQKKQQVTGLNLDLTSLKEVLNDKFTTLEITAKTELAPDASEPQIKDSDIAAIDTVLGSYTTSFSPGARGDNIGIAAQKLAGRIIQPQQTLSFNDTVGRRTHAAGYKNAGVIIGGEPAIDVGGGVCQVSTTLYNAVMLAGLTPTVRSNHSLPSHYVPAGRDATVADGLLDFAFQNPLPHPVYLVVTNTGSKLTISVLGTRSDLEGKTIALVTEGSYSRPSLYRIWSQDGKVVNREFMHTDSYT